MAYSKQTWDTTSYVNPTRMNHIEDGIYSADTKTASDIPYSSGVSVKDRIDGITQSIGSLECKIANLAQVPNSKVTFNMPYERTCVIAMVTGSNNYGNLHGLYVIYGRRANLPPVVIPIDDAGAITITTDASQFTITSNRTDTSFLSVTLISGLPITEVTS